MLFIPFHYYNIKAPFLIIIISAIFLKLYSNSFKLIYNKQIIVLVFYYTILGLFFIFIGINKSAPNSIYYLMPLYVLYPLLYLYFIILIDEKIFRGLQRIMIYSVVAITIYNIISFAMYTGLVAKNNYFIALGTVHNATFSESGISTINTVTISTLIFVIPYILAIVLSNSSPSFLKIKRFTYIGILLFGFIGMILSGRRAFFISTFVSILTFYIFILFLPRKEMNNILRAQIKNIWIIGFPTIVLIYAFIYFIKIDFSLILTSLTSYDINSDIYRTIQASSLLDGIVENPLIGKGHGTVADIIRSDKPWRYELSYLSLLFHTGLIGTSLYSIGFIWIYYRGFRIISLGGEQAIIMIGLLNGFTAMVISYATNPYFDAFDILWVIFLPIAYINIISTNLKNINTSGLSRMSYLKKKFN
jgi:hypothetical protein